MVNLGFDVKIISARIFKEDVLGPEFDHLALIVNLVGKSWLADVGFGDLFVKPLQIESTDKQFDGRNYYKIENVDHNTFLLWVSTNGTVFEKKYQFQTDAKKIEEFEEQCKWKQQDPSSYFVINKIVTVPIPNGRKTLFNTKYSVKTGITKTEISIESEKDEIRILKKEFNIRI